jgi:type VI secretion system protein VasD
MRVRHHQLVLAAVVISAVVAGCGKALPPIIAPKPVPEPEPVEALLTISAAVDANPDSTGRPSPIVVRLYQLKGDGAFESVEFFGLFDDDHQALGADLVDRSEFVLTPSEERTVKVAVNDDTRFVGALAAFRDIRNAQWRVIVPTWSEGTKHVTVSIERARIVATVGDPPADRAQQD